MRIFSLFCLVLFFPSLAAAQSSRCDNVSTEEEYQKCIEREGSKADFDPRVIGSGSTSSPNQPPDIEPQEQAPIDTLPPESRRQVQREMAKKVYAKVGEWSPEARDMEFDYEPSAAGKADAELRAEEEAAFAAAVEDYHNREEKAYQAGQAGGGGEGQQAANGQGANSQGGGGQGEQAANGPSNVRVQGKVSDTGDAGGAVAGQSRSVADILGDLSVRGDAPAGAGSETGPQGDTGPVTIAGDVSIDRSAQPNTVGGGQSGAEESGETSGAAGAASSAGQAGAQTGGASEQSAPSGAGAASSSAEQGDTDDNASAGQGDVSAGGGTPDTFDPETASTGGAGEGAQAGAQAGAKAGSETASGAPTTSQATTQSEQAQTAPQPSGQPVPSEPTDVASAPPQNTRSGIPSGGEASPPPTAPRPIPSAAEIAAEMLAKLFEEEEEQSDFSSAPFEDWSNPDPAPGADNEALAEAAETALEAPAGEESVPSSDQAALSRQIEKQEMQVAAATARGEDTADGAQRLDGLRGAQSDDAAPATPSATAARRIAVMDLP